MKINRISTNNTNPAQTGFKGGRARVAAKIARAFSKIDGIGEGASIACDFLGKAAVVPAVIMLSSREPKEKKEYSALKNPVAAIIQLALEVPLLMFGSKAIENAANNGVLDKNGERIYNEKFHRDAFISSMRNAAQSNAETALEAENIVKLIDKKGLKRITAESIEDFIEKSPANLKEGLKISFKNYSDSHKKLFHLQNRLCFAAAIALTPLLCALENKIHPIVMDKIYKEEEKHARTAAAGKVPGTVSNAQPVRKHLPHSGLFQHLSIHSFVERAKKGGMA